MIKHFKNVWNDKESREGMMILGSIFMSGLLFGLFCLTVLGLIF